LLIGDTPLLNGDLACGGKDTNRKREISMESHIALEKETEVFINACEGIHARLEYGPLSTHDRDAIIIIAHDLLTELRS
jgi:hypothetical protein